MLTGSLLVSAVALAAAVVWLLYHVQVLGPVWRTLRNVPDEVDVRTQALLDRYHAAVRDPLLERLQRGVEEDARCTGAASRPAGRIQHEAEGARPSASADSQ